MANYCVAWLLLLSYVTLLGWSGFGIGLTALNFGVPVKPPPKPPALNETERNYGYNWNRPPKIFEGFDTETHMYSSYDSEPGLFLACPCGVSALMSALLVLSGICSRKIFSKTIGLYSSLAMWILTLLCIILFQCIAPRIARWQIPKNEGFWLKVTWVLGIQFGMLSLLSLQIILAIWELKRQKITWPKLHSSHLFTLNTMFLITRITASSYAFASLVNSDFWFGIQDNNRQIEYDLDIYSYPVKKYPDFFVYPVAVAILYDIVASLEGLLSHLTGYVHMKMLCLSSLLTSIFYGGIIVLTSPVFVLRVFGQQLYSNMMNCAIGAVFACLVHAVVCLAKPEIVTAPPSALRAVMNRLIPSVTYNSENLRNNTASIRNRFKWSDTLLYNTIVLVLSSLAILLECIDFREYWGFVTMLCGNVAIINRVLPIVMMEVLTQRIESVPVFKTMMHFMLETIPLVVGVIANLWWFYGPLAGAIIVNGMLVLLQLYTVTNPAAKAAATNLPKQEADGSTGRQLVLEIEDFTDSPLEDGKDRKDLSTYSLKA